MSMSLKTKATYVDNDKVKKLFEKYDLNKNGVMEKDEFIKVMVDILTELGEDISEQYLQAFISVFHNYGNLTNRGEEYKTNHSVSESTWTTYNGGFAEVLRKRRKCEWKIITEGKYYTPYTPEISEVQFDSETPFTDWCKEYEL